MRSALGEDLHPVLADVERYTKERPALAAFLDSSGFGDSPQIVLMLAAVARNPDIVKSKESAAAYIARVKADKNHAYWRGEKLAVLAQRIAYEVAG